MYVPGTNDKAWLLAVWGRGPLKDKAVVVTVFRRTLFEARAFVAGLGYELIDAGR